MHSLTLVRRAVPPSFIPLIEQMRFFIEPEISCSRFFKSACVEKDGAQTELGSFVAQHLHGGLLIDIPCGLDTPLSKEDVAVGPLVRTLGAQEYWEVDLMSDVIGDRVPKTIDVFQNGHYSLQEKISDAGMRTLEGMTIATMQDDVLGFIAKISDDKRNFPIALYISALQPDATLCQNIDSQKEVIAPYLNALYDELSRVTQKNDLVILNSSTMLVTGVDEERFPFIHPAIALPARGLSLMRRCPRDKVHVFLREQ